MNFSRTGVFSAAALLSTILSASSLLNSCSSGNNTNAARYKLTGDTIADGKKLVELHCTKCHEQVPVDALSKNIWHYHTLPAMAPYLGISTYGESYFKKDPLDTAGLTMLEWQSIVTYYKKMAPDSVKAAPPPVVLSNDMAGFTVKQPAMSSNIAYTTMVRFNPDNHKIYTADGVKNELTEWDDQLKSTHAIKIPSAAVNASFFKDAEGGDAVALTCIGQLEGMDFPNGRVLQIGLDAASGPKEQKPIATELSRPVQTVAGDFNKDGLMDWAICGQGGKSGEVYLLQQNKDHSYSQSTIVKKAGAVQAVAGDFNNDGWTDLMVLFGSADEGLWIYLNDHKGGFTEKNLLRFPPVYGSSSFQLTDIDHDGKPDLIYTCGYNFHDSRILKPYHGLYIFTNQGDWQFKQTWFYPINGCTKAVAADFDGDGDLDIATTAFFADFAKNPAEGCIYFEQKSKMDFTPHALPVSKYGRWMSMDVADVNNDGKPDILLGNYSKGFKITQPKIQWEQKLPFILLINGNKK